MTRNRRSNFAQWVWPIGLAALTLAGLLSALLGEGGIWWWLSWVALAIPLLVILRHVLFPANQGEPRYARRRAS